MLWLNEGRELAAYMENCTLVAMVANIFGKDPKALDDFNPYKET